MIAGLLKYILERGEFSCLKSQVIEESNTNTTFIIVSLLCFRYFACNSWFNLWKLGLLCPLCRCKTETVTSLLNVMYVPIILRKTDQVSLSSSLVLRRQLYGKMFTNFPSVWQWYMYKHINSYAIELFNSTREKSCLTFLNTRRMSYGAMEV